ncbi:hypothetical protein PLUTE_a2427 [Pseudoalteromonas luteoviolacea DSM 6061]|nr:hypothetical protein [Pseudoalteromonas luteoviolacea DSM 6061]
MSVFRYAQVKVGLGYIPTLNNVPLLQKWLSKAISNAPLQSQFIEQGLLG